MHVYPTYTYAYAYAYMHMHIPRHASPGYHPLQVLVVLWIGYFISLVAVVEMMPRTFSRFTGFLGSKVNYIMWWCATM